jgi:hypothetical protein
LAAGFSRCPFITLWLEKAGEGCFCGSGWWVYMVLTGDFNHPVFTGGKKGKTRRKNKFRLILINCLEAQDYYLRFIYGLGNIIGRK